MAFEIEGGEWLCVAFLFLCVIGVGICIGATIADGGKDIEVSQETADKICLEITGEEGVVAKDWWDYGYGKEPMEKGELYCQLPSYDETHLIKVGN